MSYKLCPKELAEIYTDLESDHFGLGEVIKCDEDSVLLYSILPNGKNDGLLYYRLSVIAKIAVMTKYCMKMKEIVTKHNDGKGEYQVDSDLLEWLLKSSKNNRKIIDIQLCNSHQCDITGIFEKEIDGICFVRQFNNFGEEDGICQFCKEDITSIRYDTLENRAIEALIIS